MFTPSLSARNFLWLASCLTVSIAAHAGTGDVVPVPECDLQQIFTVDDTLGGPILIRNGSTTNDVITVVNTGSIEDVNFGLDLDHSHNGDLILSLSHNGTTITLIHRPGVPPGGITAGFPDDGYAGLILDDEGTDGPIEDATNPGSGNSNGNPGPVSGSYTPHQLLAAFDGMEVAGDWTLTIQDLANVNGGTDGEGSLVNWSLEFDVSREDCNSSGIADVCELSGNDCNNNSIPDECDIDSGASLDCNGNNTPDECELSGNDCNNNNVPDECELSDNDCNSDGIPDDCQLAGNDCNLNSVPDDCELPGNDCNGNNILDKCDLEAGAPDCNGNSLPDECDIGGGLSLDCDSNLVPDECELVGNDCNANLIPDNCDIDSGDSEDCNGNGYPDECELEGNDCNGNGVLDRCELDGDNCNGNDTLDECEIASGASQDCNGNSTPDECELAGNDCNTNQIPDECELEGNDCNTNQIPDECDISSGSPDCNLDGIPDSCQLDGNDCNNNGTLDKCDLTSGSSADCNEDSLPDECQLTENDCNNNNVPDECDIDSGASLDCNDNNTPDECELSGNDCNNNNVPDECDIDSGASLDCNDNNTPDECELSGNDCNNNNVPDECDIDSGASLDCNNNNTPDECDLDGNDCNENQIPDECELVANDCNTNQIPDDCDIAGGASQDCQLNSIPDECELADNDCNKNSIPDDCELVGNDCNDNGTPDDCELVENDCNANKSPDECDIESGFSPDCNRSNVPDECELRENDCNNTKVPDECELAGNDCNLSGLPDECELAGNDCNNNNRLDICEVTDTLYSIDHGSNSLYRMQRLGGAWEIDEEYSIELPDVYVCGSRALAVDPQTQEIYAAVITDRLVGGGNGNDNNNGDARSGCNTWDLVRVEPATGHVTYVGTLSERVSDLTFDANGTLYAVTGNGTSVPVTLWQVSLMDATMTQIVGLPTGDGLTPGETIGFNPESGLIYHLTGPNVGVDRGQNENGMPDLTPRFSSVNPNTLQIADIPVVNGDDLFPLAMTWWSEQSRFMVVSFDGFYSISPTGTVFYEGFVDHPSKGIAFVEGTGSDCNLNLIPDDCEMDCNSNNVPDACEVAEGLAGSGIPDILGGEIDQRGSLNAFHNFYQVNTASGLAFAKGPITPGSTFDSFKDVAVDPTTGLAYSVTIPREILLLLLSEINVDPELLGIDDPYLYLYRIDPDTGEGVQLPQPLMVGDGEPTFVLGLAFAPDGTLYGIGDGLYRLDKDTGAISDQINDEVFGLGMASSSEGDFYSLNWTQVVGDETGGIPFAASVIQLHDSETGDVTEDWMLEDASGSGRMLLDIAFGPDGMFYGVTRPLLQMPNTGKGDPSTLETNYDLVLLDLETSTFTSVGPLRSALVGLGGMVEPSSNADCNLNNVPDNCELAENDCNINGVPDECELKDNDCNANSMPDDCEIDTDSDGVIDECDECPEDPTAVTAPCPGGGGGGGGGGDDGGFPDRDRDGVIDDEDNCPEVANPDQANFDGGSQGDACDDDDDNDGFDDPDDLCPQSPPNEPIIRDGCTADQLAAIGNENGGIDPAVDFDGDGVGDNVDNCPETPNADQADFDEDGIGDVCDDDDDDDEFLDPVDLCPETPLGEPIVRDGCSQSQLDDLPGNENVNENGTPPSQANDNVNGNINENGDVNVNENGVTVDDIDGDGVPNDEDLCPGTPGDPAYNGCPCDALCGLCDLCGPSGSGLVMLTLALMLMRVGIRRRTHR